MTSQMGELGEAVRQGAAARTYAEARPSIVSSAFGDDSERLESELRQLQARLEQRSAELNLAQAEKTWYLTLTPTLTPTHLQPSA